MIIILDWSYNYRANNTCQQVAPVEIYVKQTKTHTKNTNLIWSQQTYIYICVYPYWQKVLLNLYLMHTGPHICAYANTRKNGFLSSCCCFPLFCFCCLFLCCILIDVGKSQKHGHGRTLYASLSGTSFAGRCHKPVTRGWQWTLTFCVQRPVSSRHEPRWHVRHNCLLHHEPIFLCASLVM